MKSPAATLIALSLSALSAAAPAPAQDYAANAQRLMELSAAQLERTAAQMERLDQENAAMWAARQRNWDAYQRESAAQSAAYQARLNALTNTVLEQGRVHGWAPSRDSSTTDLRSDLDALEAQVRRLEAR